MNRISKAWHQLRCWLTTRASPLTCLKWFFKRYDMGKGRTTFTDDFISRLDPLTSLSQIRTTPKFRMRLLSPLSYSLPIERHWLWLLTVWQFIMSRFPRMTCNFTSEFISTFEQPKQQDNNRGQGGWLSGCLKKDIIIESAHSITSTWKFS